MHKPFRMMVLASLTLACISHAEAADPSLGHWLSGSGQIAGRPDGTIGCDFCGQCYIVRVQPTFAGMPQQPGMGAPTDTGPEMMDPGMLGPDGMPLGGDPAMGGEELPPDAEMDEDGDGGAPPFGEDEDEAGGEDGGGGELGGSPPPSKDRDEPGSSGKSKSKPKGKKKPAQS